MCINQTGVCVCVCICCCFFCVCVWKKFYLLLVNLTFSKLSIWISCIFGQFLYLIVIWVVFGSITLLALINAQIILLLVFFCVTLYCTGVTTQSFGHLFAISFSFFLWGSSSVCIFVYLSYISSGRICISIRAKQMFYMFLLEVLVTITCSNFLSIDPIGFALPLDF